MPEPLDVVAYAVDVEDFPVVAHAHVGIVLVLQKIVGEALLQSLPAGEPRLLCHHAAQGVHRDPGLGVVDFSHGPLAGVHSLHKLFHVLNVQAVPEIHAYAVDHNEGSGVHGHGVACAHNHAGGACCDPFHDDVHLSAESFQGVVDCDPGVKVAAAAVQLDGDVAFVLDRCQILHEALRGDVESGLRFARPPVCRLFTHNVAV